MNTKSTIFMVAMVVSLILGLPFANAGEYDVTECFSGTLNPLFSSEKLTIISFEGRGIVRSNTPDKTVDNATAHCLGIIRIVGGEYIMTGNTKYQLPDGSIFVIEMNQKNQEGSAKFLYGTGKMEGIEGGGPWKKITSGKPITPGTFQFCNRATGTDNLKR